VLDTTREFHAETTINARAEMSKLRDLDYAEAATQLNLRLLTLQAAQASFAKINGLTLFDYIR
jgi:flagellar hook-associated protein 3 FlgL